MRGCVSRKASGFLGQQQQHIRLPSSLYCHGAPRRGSRDSPIPSSQIRKGLTEGGLPGRVQPRCQSASCSSARVRKRTLHQRTLLSLPCMFLLPNKSLPMHTAVKSRVSRCPEESHERILSMRGGKLRSRQACRSHCPLPLHQVPQGARGCLHQHGQSRPGRFPLDFRRTGSRSFRVLARQATSLLQGMRQPSDGRMDRATASYRARGHPRYRSRSTTDSPPLDVACGTLAGPW